MTALKDELGSGRPMEPVIFAISGTAFVVVVAVIAFFVFVRKSRLNWYERNLLEIADTKPEYIRYRISRSDTVATEGDGRSVTSLSEPGSPTSDHSRYSKHSLDRPRFIKQHSRLYVEEDGRKSSKPLDIPANIGEKFVVPKSRSCTNISMFQRLEKSQFDQKLYDIRQDSAASDGQQPEACGHINLACSYDVKLSLLTVSFRQATDIIAPRADGPPNPYFKVTLNKPEPNANPYTQQSKIYRQTHNPEMSDDFYFDVPVGQLHECKLEILAHDFDPCSEDEVFAYCWLDFARMGISADPDNPIVCWAEMLPVALPSDSHGEVLFSVAYLAKAQRLTVSIFKARKLRPPTDFPGLPDPSVWVTVSCAGKKLKRKKTSSKRGTIHPTYNESLLFSIPKNSLCDIVLDLEVVHDPGMVACTFRGTYRVMGQLQLPLSKCKDLWRAVIRGENSKARWYPLQRP